MNCPRCGSGRTKKKGISHTAKQNYYCHSCQRQFLERGQDWFISDAQRTIIDKLLLERMSLSGICRVVGVSESWLYAYIKELYAALPDELNAEAELPCLEDYLADRMEEEIHRIEHLKKIQLHLKSISRSKPARKTGKKR